MNKLLLNGGELNRKRLLGTRTIEVMTSVAAPDALPGRPKGEGYGLSVRVVNDPIARNSFMSAGTFGGAAHTAPTFSWIRTSE